MNARELRIDNLITYCGKTHLLQSVGPAWCHSQMALEEIPIDQFEPIPLTEEWLLKLGFESNNKTNREEGYLKGGSSPASNIYIRTFIEPHITGFFSVFNHSECNKNELQFIRKIEYVHQLQNLYFALTGEELNVIENGKESN